MPRRFGGTFGRSPEALSEDVLTWWREGFPARTSASQARGQDSLASAAASSSTSCDWFASFDPDTCSWRTSQQSLFEDSTPYSERWPKAGSMRNGRASKRPTLARLMDGIAGGFSRGTESNWPTPRVAAERSSRSSMTVDGHWAAPALEQMAELSMGVLPREFHDEQELTPQAKRIWESGRQWQTPSVADTTGGHLTRGGNRSGELLLRGQAKHWATPRARDWKGGEYPDTLSAQAESINSPQGQTTETDGATILPGFQTSRLQLNERFVEALMGLRPGWTCHCDANATEWTASEDSATPWYPRRQRPPCAHCGSEHSASGREAPAWAPCGWCEDWYCRIHQEHAYDCACPPIEEWDVDPYTSGGPLEVEATA